MTMTGLRQPWTVEDLEELPEDGRRYEIMDGELLVSPAPTGGHQALLMNLIDWLREHEAKPDERVLPGVGVLMPSDDRKETYLIPDCVIVKDRKRIQKNYRPDEVRLVVEIVSPSTTKQDRGEKWKQYAAASIQTYVLVDGVLKPPRVARFELERDLPVQGALRPERTASYSEDHQKPFPSFDELNH